MKNKAKYKIGDIVYCRPWIVSACGMYVFRGEVESVNFCAGSPYYTIRSLDGKTISHVRYEQEISRRPERLVKEARKKVDEVFGPQIKAHKMYHDDLDKLLKEKGK